MGPNAHTCADRVEQAVLTAVEAGLVGGEHPVAGFVDIDGVRSTVRDLRAAFEGTEVLHAFAAKASPLVPVLRLLAEEGLGCEVASAGELAQALAAGFEAGRIVLDSPAKTQAELAEALELGVAVNADNLDELKRLDALVTPDTRAVIGARVNPQVGAGTIGAMSTASPHSKFGIPLGDPGSRDELLAAFAARPWLTRLHVHVGSQGCPLELIADGVEAVYRLAEEINANAGRQQVTSLDIGGGLPVNFADDTVSPTFAEYVAVLRDRVPGLFEGRYALLTEFGRSLLAKNGFIVAAVEYVKDAGGRRIAVTHAGAQIATRTVFMPGAWPLRVEAFDASGRRKRDRPLRQDVAGPCCFAGDLVASERELPELAEGDLVVLRDTGAYYFSSPFSYNSLPRPAVHGFRAAEGEMVFAPVRTGQTVAEIVAESGAEHRDALLA
ncbi:diaminopimelate decarboxylase [Saccharomonospora sp. NPDC006951]